MSSAEKYAIEPKSVNYFIWPKHCFAFVESNTNWHAHPAIQLYCSLGKSNSFDSSHTFDISNTFDKNIEVELETGEVITGQLLAIPSHTVRKVKQSSPILQFTFHPFDTDVKAIHRLNEVQSLDLSESFYHVVNEFIQQGFELEKAGQVKQVCEALIRSITYQTTMDDRVSQAFGHLSLHYQNKMVISDVADELSISESRLQHLFKEQIGMTMSRYQQWLRLRMSFQQIAQGSKVIDAAMESGFTDQAHFSNLFKRFFGYAPNDLLRKYGDADIRIMEMMTQ